MPQYYCPTCRKITYTPNDEPRGGNFVCRKDNTRMLKVKPIYPLDEWTDEMFEQAAAIFKAMTRGYDVGSAFTSSSAVSGLFFIPQNKDVPEYLKGVLIYTKALGWEYLMNIEPYLDEVGLI